MVSHTATTERIMEKTRTKNKGYTERQKVVIAMYPDHSVMEIGTYLKCDCAALYKFAKKLGLKHTEETSRRIKRKQMENLKKAYSKEVNAKRKKTRAKVQMMEEFRAISGKPQLTNIRMKQMPDKSYHAKYHLIRKYGYFGFDGEPYIIGYDQNTKRCNEDYFKKKYGFTFEEDALCQEN